MMTHVRSLISIGIFVLLFCTLVFGLGPSLSARLVLIGEKIWDGYAQDLRYDPVKPECDLADLEIQLQTCPIQASTKTESVIEDVDPFAEPSDDD